MPLHKCHNAYCHKVINTEKEPFVRLQYSDEAPIHFCCNACRKEFEAQNDIFKEAAKPFHEPFKPPRRSELASR